MPDLDQPRSITQLARTSLAVYWRYLLLFLALALAVVVPFELAALAITGHGPLRPFGASIIPLDDLLRFTFLSPLISALHVHAVRAIGEGQSPRLTDVAKRGLQVLPVVTATEIVANIGIYIGYVALLVPGLVLSLMWSVAAQSAAVEREGWLDALRSSRRLARGHWPHIFGLQLLVGLVSGAVLLAARELPLGASTSTGSVTVGIAVRTAVWSLTALTGAMLYFDLRAREATRPTIAPREYAQLRDLDT
jgi:hypothetical protein